MDTNETTTVVEAPPAVSVEPAKKRKAGRSRKVKASAPVITDEDRKVLDSAFVIPNVSAEMLDLGQGIKAPPGYRFCRVSPEKLDEYKADCGYVPVTQNAPEILKKAAKLGPDESVKKIGTQILCVTTQKNYDAYMRRCEETEKAWTRSTGVGTVQGTDAAIDGKVETTYQRGGKNPGAPRRDIIQLEEGREEKLNGER